MCGSAQTYEILGKILQNIKECTAENLKVSVPKKILSIHLNDIVR